MAIFDKLYDQMLYCWHLTKDEFIYMPEQASGKIVHIRVLKGEVTSVKEFQLPEDIAIKSPISANLDTLVESFNLDDKQALRDLISSEAEAVKSPEMMRITCMRNKIFFLADEDKV